MDILQKSLSSFEKPDAALLEKTINEMAKGRARQSKKLLPVVAAVVAILFISTTVFAAFGGFEFFMQRVNPPFGEIISPVMEYVEDQGIRITILGARRFDTAAVVYLSIQDVTGEDRVTETTNVFRGFPADVTDIFAGFPTDKNMQMFTSGFGTTWSSIVFHPLYFDGITNTRYFQVRLNSNHPLQNELRMIIEHISLEREYCDSYIPINEVSVTGNWSATIYVENAHDEALYLENLVFYVYGIRYTVREMRINPISVQMHGRVHYDTNEREYVDKKFPLGDGEYLQISRFSYEHGRVMHHIYVEHAGEMVRARGSGGSTASGTQRGSYAFRHTFNFEFPLDLSEIVAIIINGERFDIP